VDAAFASADVIVEGEYTLQPIEHAPIETHACVAKPEADGRLTVHTNTQALYFTLDNTAIILGVPSNRIRMIGGTVGGGFGGKVDVIMEPLSCIAALKTGRPVKWRFTRKEEFTCSSTRSAVKLQYRDGLLKDGRIVARYVRSLEDAGAYHRHTPYGAQKHMANVRAHDFVTDGSGAVWTRLTPPARPHVPPVLSGRAGGARHAQPFAGSRHLLSREP
jgi:CO/xanthine dehydrogenase Mo-binding subunit